MSYLGLDIGSVSVSAAWTDDKDNIIESRYVRHFGKPTETAINILEEELGKDRAVDCIAFTGSGGKYIASKLQAPFENEIVCQSRACKLLTPEARTLIVIGGEDSYLIILGESENRDAVEIRDFAMNGICAAGAGSFLDQQASRLGVDIIGEFGDMAVRSQRPSRVAGRCSVFAKTDMIHLQQKATPVEDIVSGLCFAFARNFVAVLARGKELNTPIAFHGGVALNAGMQRAFKEVMEIADGDLIVSDQAECAGAIGAAMLARKTGRKDLAVDCSRLRDELLVKSEWSKPLPALPDPGAPPPSTVFELEENEVVDAYLGVDVGSISTNLVVIDDKKRVLAKRYLMTAGRPIEAVRKGLDEIAPLLADKVNIRGVCTTGSGRYLTGDFLGADVVKNEITAQARAAAEIDPEVDTIFEIGGQDSKYISLENGAIVDFEMNKVCAAGTGSFLEEQAEKLGVKIKGEFADIALSAEYPVRLGERCTVFMESDVIGHQAQGARADNLAAGLAYSTVYNYLNRVVADKKVGDKIFFQGGTAYNRAVVAAFKAVTGKEITVPEHHEVTGALGCCLIAMEHAKEGVASSFRGWDVRKLGYSQSSFECKACSNACEINRIEIEGQKPLVYGGRCEKWEKKRSEASGVRDLFGEREKLITKEYVEGKKGTDGILVGIPRALHFMEYAPFWIAFFNHLNIPIKFSSPTNKEIVEDGIEAVLAEFCFPVKVAHGHVIELLNEGVSHVFLPLVLHLPKLQEGYDESVQCPYVSTIPITIRAALDCDRDGVEIIAPSVDLSLQDNNQIAELYDSFRTFGVTKKQIMDAILAGSKSQNEFQKSMTDRGREVLSKLGPDDKAVVIVSRGYNGCDSGVNLELPQRFRDLGVTPIPLDMIPLEEVDLSSELPTMSWRSGHKILTGAEIVRDDPRLHAVYITNFGCGPDSFLLKFFGNRMGDKSYLQIEVDEHSSDVGALTRCEAFLDSIQNTRRESREVSKLRPNHIPGRDGRTIYLPYMNDAAVVVSAAFRSVGIDSKSLPPSDHKSVEIGKRYCTGKECFPAIVTTGDMIRLLEDPETDPDKVVFFMPSVSGSGGCRFGCYNLLQRMVLDSNGYEDVPIFAPNQNKGFYDSLGKQAGNSFTRRAWNGLIAIELLERAMHHVRPYELTDGASDAAYQEYLAKIENAIERGRDLTPIMREAREAFSNIPTSGDGRPYIGIVGEVFVRSHEFSNQEVIRKIEEHGGKVWAAPLSEWLLYVNHGQKTDRRKERKWMEYLNVSIIDHVMRKDEKRLSDVWAGFMPNAHEVPTERLIELGSEYVDRDFFGEPMISLGKSVHMHKAGLAGIVNIMPFTCMLGTITNGLLRKFQTDYDNMPMLNLAFDGQEIGDLTIRLEAFLEQCRGYKSRTSEKTPVK